MEGYTDESDAASEVPPAPVDGAREYSWDDTFTVRESGGGGERGGREEVGHEGNRETVWDTDQPLETEEEGYGERVNKAHAHTAREDGERAMTIREFHDQHRRHRAAER
jgi:hypothetical protein